MTLLYRRTIHKHLFETFHQLLKIMNHKMMSFYFVLQGMMYRLTTPGKQLSASMLGPSNVWWGDPAELSELLSGLEGILLPTCINLAVINWNIKQKTHINFMYIPREKSNVNNSDFKITHVCTCIFFNYTPLKDHTSEILSRNFIFVCIRIYTL